MFKNSEYQVKPTIKKASATIKQPPAVVKTRPYSGAAKVNIVEVDEVVEAGELDPESIVTPGIWVDRIVVRPEEGWVKEVQKW